MGLGIDLLTHGLPVVGTSDILDWDDRMTGGGAVAFDTTSLMAGYADPAFAQPIASTGGAQDETAPPLAGDSGTDTLADATASEFFATFGGATAIDRGARPDSGSNRLWGGAAFLPQTETAEDLSISLILHRIEMFSFLAPSPVAFRTGCAG
jgi:hypothetical protein